MPLSGVDPPSGIRRASCALWDGLETPEVVREYCGVSD
jgi:hypothetical protein